MIVNLLDEGGFYGEGIVQVPPVEHFLGLLAVDNSYTFVVELWSSCSSDHLKQISRREIGVMVGFGIEVLGSFDNDESSREVDSPCKGRRSYQYLDLIVNE